MTPGRRTGSPRGGAGSQAVTTPNGSSDSTPEREDGQGSLLAELEEGRNRRDAGAQAAENSVHTFWRVAAENAIRELAASLEPFDVEDVYRKVGPPPGHHNAAGSLFLSAARKGLIRRVGYRQSRRRERHGAAVAVWVGAS